MIERLSTHWWVFLVRGVLALAAGVLALVFPVAAIIAVTFLFGAYALMDGIFALVAGARMQHGDGKWLWLILEGVLGIAVGAYVFAFPGNASVTLALLLGAWALVSGIFALVSAAALRRWVPGETWLLIGAIVSIVFGIAALGNIAIGLTAIAYLFAFYALAAGIVFVGLALRLRGLRARTAIA